MLKLGEKQRLLIKWIPRIAAIGIVLFGLPFYFGYGNPLPFMKPQYSFLDNLWLTIFPLIFIGLILGWVNENLGGLIVSIPITIGLVINLVIEKDIALHMFVPLITGFLYLLSAYIRKQRK